MQAPHEGHTPGRAAYQPHAHHVPHSATQNATGSHEHRDAQQKRRHTRFFDAVITVSITALFLGVPLFFTSLTMQGIVFDKQMYFYFWLLVATVAWATKSAMTGELTLRRTPLDYPIIGLIGVMLVSTFFSDDRWHSLWGAFGDPSRGLISVLAAVVAFYLIVTHFSWSRFRWFFGALLLSGSIVVVWTFLGLLGVGFLPASLAASAPLSLIGSLKGLTLFMSAIIPLLVAGIFGLWKEDARVHVAVRYGVSIVLGVVVVLALINIFSLLGYAPLIPLAVGVAFFLVFILAQIVRPHGTLSFIPMVVLVVVAGFLMTQSPGNTIHSPFIREGLVLPPEITVDKAFSWDIAKASLKEHFFFGYGPALYGHAFSLARPESFNNNPLYTLRFLQGEGALFDGVSTVGVLGVIMMMLVFVTFFGVAIYLMTRNQEYNKVYSLGFVSAVIILGIATAMYRVEGSIVLVGVLVAALAWAVLYHESKMPFQTLALSLKASPKFALTLAFISIVLIAGVGMSFFFVGKMFAADVFAGTAVHAREVSEDTINNLTRATRLNGREGNYFTRIGQEFMVLANREALKSEGERDIQKLSAYLQAARAAALQGRTLSPADAAAAEVYAQILENTSYYDPAFLDAADEAYAAAQKLEPSNALYVAKRAEIALRKALLIDKKKEDERKEALAHAKDLFSEAIDKKANLASAYYQRALIKQELGDLDGAIEDMEKAFIASGNANITYAYSLGVLYKTRDKENDAARAELLFRSILGVNDKEVNTHLELATLYERKDKKAAAIAEYKKVLELLPKDGENVAAARENIKKIIARLEQSGVSVEPTQDTAQTPSVTAQPEATAQESSQTTTQEATGPQNAAAQPSPATDTQQQ